MARIDRDQVFHVARLARLTLSEQEVSAITPQLERVLEHIAQLAEVDTTGIEPTAQVGVERLPFRTDAVVASVDRARVLEAAPDIAGGGFVVPAFVED